MMRSVTMENVLGKLSGVQVAGEGYMAQCPAHDDDKASLCVSEGRDGRVLLHCFAGCTVEEICDAAGLKMSDLFQPTTGKNPVGIGYAYKNATGVVVYVKMRHPGPVKKFSVRHPTDGNNWDDDMGDAAEVLYRLPELMAADPSEWVYVVEGEKDVESLRALGLVATCNTFGAGNWKSLSDDSALEGRRVAIIADADSPGRRHAVDVAQRLHGRAAEVRTLELPGEGVKDASDWVMLGGTAEGLLALVEGATQFDPEVVVPLDVTDTSGLRHDTRNGAEFAIAYGDRIRYCPDSDDWLAWDGQRWIVDAVHEAEHLFQKLAHKKLAAAVDIAGDDTRKEELKHWDSSMRTTRVRDALTAARSDPRLIVRRKDLDADPWLFNCKNGTLDLRTGTLKMHNRDDFLTKMCPVVYDAEAPQDEWMAFLERVVPDKATRAFLCRAVGYSLTGDTGEEKLFFISGPAATGKSTFLDAIRTAIGEYSAVADFSTFLQRTRGGSNSSGDLARLAGVRFCSSIEVEDGQKMAEGLISKVTGGDIVTCRHLYSREQEYQPQFKLWLAANHRPSAKDDATAFWRRVLSIPFEVEIPEGERDPQVKARLRDPIVGGPEVLAWAVRGCLEWQKSRLGASQVVKAATRAYRAENDPLADWLEANTRDEPGAETLFQDLYEDYKKWLVAGGMKYPISGMKMGTRLAARGYEIITMQAGATRAKGRRGIRLLDPPATSPFWDRLEKARAGKVGDS